GTSRLFAWLESCGLRYVEFDQTGPPPESADLIWLEAPSNPYLTFPDLEAAVAQAVPVLVDATASTPVLFRPLEHGADFVLHSATKYLGGLLSFDVSGDPARLETSTKLIANATSLGGVDSVLEARHRWEGDRVPRGLIRLSVGLEEVEALWADLEQALAASRSG